jgi:mannitol 2-dehydrogenase
LPVVRDRLAQGGDVRRSALVVAAWARYAEGFDEDGTPIDVVDPRRHELMELAGRQHEDPTSFLAARDIFGPLSTDPRFVHAYVEALESLHRDGARATVARAASYGAVRNDT